MINLSIILIGFTAMSSQIVLMREFLVAFYGNELSMGFILASWLAAGAIGSYILGRFADKIMNKIAIFWLCQIALTALLPLNIVAIRSVKIALNINPGEIVGLFPIAFSSFVILAPTCIVLGFMFSLACRIYRPELNIGAVKIGRVYVLEAVGAMTGGLIASFILIKLVGSIQIMAILSMLNVAASGLLALSSKKRGLIIISLFLFIAGILMWVSKGWEGIDKDSLKRQWKGVNLVASKNSIYGNVAVASRGGETSFFNNGLLLYSVPDKLNAEEAVHFALLEHANPSSVLLVGGGIGGLIGEIAKHPVERIDYVELDPLIIKMAKENLPAEYSAPLKDSRVSIKNVDGRLFIKRTPQKYDCVIIHVGDPYTAQVNRYYTVEFFREVKRVLKEGGVVSFTATASENYINDPLADFLASLYTTLKMVFRDSLIIPGDTAIFIACDKYDILTYDYNSMMTKAAARKLDIKYVREYYLFSKLSADRISYTEDSVKKRTGSGINYDFRPISYYYNLTFWATRFKDSIFAKVLRSVNEGSIWIAGFIVYFVIILSGIVWAVRRKRSFERSSALAVMTTGFSEMAFQMVVLLSFQIIYGYVFYKLGLILTSFMVGLTFGGWWVTRIMPGLKKDRAAFLWTQAAICIYPLILPVLFQALSGTRNQALSWMGSNILFPFLPAVAGFIGGFQFPLAGKICLDKDRNIGKVAGLNYGVDLLGSCMGALLTGAFLIPVVGIPKTCVLVAGMNFVVLIVLFLSRKNV